LKGKKDSSPTISQSIMLIVKNKKPETTQELIKLVKEEHYATEKEILERILDLQKKGKIVLKQKTTPIPSGRKEYLLSTEAYWYWAIIALATAVIIAVFTISENSFPLVYARHLLGLIFVLWLPGYCFIKALFPTKEIDSIERFALSIVTSLVLVPLTGMILNFTPWGITLTSVTTSLLALTLALATAAIMREHPARKEKNTKTEEKNCQTNIKSCMLLILHHLSCHCLV